MFYIYIIFDFAMAVIMLLFGIWFYRSKGQASKFLSGYNMKSAEERKKYDENAMCKAYGKRMMFMSIPFIAGMIVFCKTFLHKIAKTFCRSLQLHFVGNCKPGWQSWYLPAI